jgi:asparagine synthase (glutamine-hydrolysing)
MCGICGSFNRKDLKAPDLSVVRKMTACLQHRGPDQDGYYHDDMVCLGHRRLTIIDLITGQQPIANEDATVQVVFNGEIYNYKTLRDDLSREGHVFKTESDTEVIVHAYEHYGPDFITHLDGMFAIALWDRKKKSLFLYRDRLGQKPLYYCEFGSSFYFSSEIKSFLSIPGFSKELDMSSVYNYAVLSYCPPAKTIFSCVLKVLPARYLRVSQTGITEKTYWQIPSRIDYTRSRASLQAELKQVLTAAVSKRLYSDVELGAFLSGGLDSSIIVALMCSLSDTTVKTFSIGFEEPAYNELSYARQVARFLKTDHHEELVRPDIGSMLDDYVYSLDQPFADSSSLPTYFLAKMTKKHVSVALSGDGGDECFAGYPRYYALFVLQTLIKRKIPYKVVMRIGAALMGLAPDGIHARSSMTNLKKLFDSAARAGSAIDMYNEWFCHFPPRESALLFQEKKEAYSFDYLADRFNSIEADSLLDRIMTTDMLSYLPNDLLHKVDSMSMAHSLEVRSPFLDHRLVECAVSMPLKHKISFFDSKIILKETFGSLLPPVVAKRRKMGFGVPIAQWLRKDLHSLSAHVLCGKRISERGIFNVTYLKRLMDEHCARKKNHAYKLWNVMMFELWCLKFLDGESL